MLHRPPDANRLDLHTTTQPDGSPALFNLRWVADDGTPQWDARATTNDAFELYNHATGNVTAWADSNDVFHVHDLAIDGTSSLDAGTLDGLDSSQFLRADTSDTMSGSLDVIGTLSEDGNAVLTTADEGSLDAGTLEGASLSQTRPSISDDSGVVVGSPTDIAAGQYLSVTADGDGTVTIDNTGGNAVGNTVTASGDGTKTTFTLTHGLGQTPASVDVTPRSADASTDFYISAIRTNDLDITYPTAPPSGTDNLQWDVTATGNDGSGLLAVQANDSGAQVGAATTLDFTTALGVSAPTSDEVAIAWETTISDNGTVAETGPTDINFDTNVSAASDGDGTVTISATDTYPSVSNAGTLLVDAPTDINAGSGITATHDGDNTVTLTATQDADTVDGVDANQFLRSDVDDEHTGTLNVTALGTASGAGDINTTDWIAPNTGVGLRSVIGSSTHRFRPRREGLQSLSNGANLPTDYGTTIGVDATLAFVETDNDTVAGWVNSNTQSLTMPGGVRVGDAGGSPAGNLSLDVRGQARFRVENRQDDPNDPEVGQMWLRTDL